MTVTLQRWRQKEKGIEKKKSLYFFVSAQPNDCDTTAMETERKKKKSLYFLCLLSQNDCDTTARKRDRKKKASIFCLCSAKMTVTERNSDGDRKKKEKREKKSLYFLSLLSQNDSLWPR